MDRIRLNYTNVLSNRVKQHGIEFSEVKKFSKKFKEIHHKIEKNTQEGKLGFRELPYDSKIVSEILSLAEKYRYRYNNFVVIGIGGSALGNIAIQQALHHSCWNMLSKEERKGWLRLFVLDNVDPAFIKDTLDVINVEETVFNIISKAGTTAECLANFFVILKELKKIYRGDSDKIKQHIIITTGPEKGFLRELVNKEGFTSFVIKDNVVGRFSVLSPVGLVSAAFTGVDIKMLLKGAREIDTLCSENENLSDNIAGMYAVLQYLLYQKGKHITVMLPYSNNLYYLADWFRQLWAESLGKKYNLNNKIVNVGPTPIKALGVTDQHSQLQLYIEGPYDKVITFISLEKYSAKIEIPSFYNHYLGGKTLNQLIKSEEEATRLALTKNLRPNLTISVPEISPYYLGQLFQFFELATAYAGELFGINAFDQPGVVLGKELTYALMSRPGYEKQKDAVEKEIEKIKSSKYIV